MWVWRPLNDNVWCFPARADGFDNKFLAGDEAVKRILLSSRFWKAFVNDDPPVLEDERIGASIASGAGQRPKRGCINRDAFLTVWHMIVKRMVRRALLRTCS
jgi:hypothetical protein